MLATSPMTHDSHEPGGPEGPVFVLHDKVEKLHPHPETSHTEHGLTYLVDGWFGMEHGRRIRVEAGSITIVPAGIPHRVLEGRDMEYWLAGFCAGCLHLDESQLLMRPFLRVRHGASPVVIIPKSRRRRLLQLFRELRDEAARGTPESPELARALLMLLLGEVHRAMPGSGPHAVEGSLVSDALAFIQRRCLTPISLKDVAAAVHRTPAHVASVVKQTTGYSVGAWISAGRVAEAAARLSHTDEPLDVIAAHVGWRDKTHFIRQFRRAYGVTPAVWRRRERGRHASQT
jgi:AraC-like DNA-binding protein